MTDKITSIDWMELDSSNIDCTYFHAKTHTICVRFKNGGIYSYIAGVDIFQGFISALSPGKWLHNVLKSYGYTRYSSEQELIDHLNCESADISADVEELLAQIKI